MPKEYLTHDELQHIEHVNKVLNDHLELVNTVCSLSEEKIQTMLDNLQNYAHAMRGVQHTFGETVTHIYRSVVDLKKVTGGTHELTAFADAVMKLDKLLTPSLVEKLGKIINVDTRSS